MHSAFPTRRKSIGRREAQEIARENEPQKTKAREHHYRGRYLAPNACSPAPRKDSVDKHHQRSHRPEYSDDLNQAKPLRPLIAEDLQMGKTVHRKSDQRCNEDQIE